MGRRKGQGRNARNMKKMMRESAVQYSAGNTIAELPAVSEKVSAAPETKVATTSRPATLPSSAVLSMPFSYPAFPEKVLSMSVKETFVPSDQMEYPIREPTRPPSSTDVLRVKNFARFIRSHHKDMNTRVTAGGRVVPVGPNPLPPTFYLPFIDRLLQNADAIKSDPTGQKVHEAVDWSLAQQEELPDSEPPVTVQDLTLYKPGAQSDGQVTSTTAAADTYASDSDASTSSGTVCSEMIQHHDGAGQVDLDKDRFELLAVMSDGSQIVRLDGRTVFRALVMRNGSTRLEKLSRRSRYRERKTEHEHLVNSTTDLLKPVADDGQCGEVPVPEPLNKVHMEFINKNRHESDTHKEVVLPPTAAVFIPAAKTTGHVEWDSSQAGQLLPLREKPGKAKSQTAVAAAAITAASGRKVPGPSEELQRALRGLTRGGVATDWSSGNLDVEPVVSCKNGRLLVEVRQANGEILTMDVTSWKSSNVSYETFIGSVKSIFYRQMLPLDKKSARHLVKARKGDGGHAGRSTRPATAPHQKHHQPVHGASCEPTPKPKPTAEVNEHLRGGAAKAGSPKNHRYKGPLPCLLRFARGTEIEITNRDDSMLYYVLCSLDRLEHAIQKLDHEASKIGERLNGVERKLAADVDLMDRRVSAPLIDEKGFLIRAIDTMHKEKGRVLFALRERFNIASLCPLTQGYKPSKIEPPPNPLQVWAHKMSQDVNRRVFDMDGKNSREKQGESRNQTDLSPTEWYVANETAGADKQETSSLLSQQELVDQNFFSYQDSNILTTKQATMYRSLMHEGQPQPAPPHPPAAAASAAAGPGGRAPGSHMVSIPSNQTSQQQGGTTYPVPMYKSPPPPMHTMRVPSGQSVQTISSISEESGVISEDEQTPRAAPVSHIKASGKYHEDIITPAQRRSVPVTIRDPSGRIIEFASPNQRSGRQASAATGGASDAPARVPGHPSTDNPHVAEEHGDFEEMRLKEINHLTKYAERITYDRLPNECKADYNLRTAFQRDVDRAIHVVKSEKWSPSKKFTKIPPVPLGPVIPSYKKVSKAESRCFLSSLIFDCPANNDQPEPKERQSTDEASTAAEGAKSNTSRIATSKSSQASGGGGRSSTGSQMSGSSRRRARSTSHRSSVQEENDEDYEAPASKVCKTSKADMKAEMDAQAKGQRPSGLWLTPYSETGGVPPGYRIESMDVIKANQMEHLPLVPYYLSPSLWPPALPASSAAKFAASEDAAEIQQQQQQQGAMPGTAAFAMPALVERHAPTAVMVPPTGPASSSTLGNVNVNIHTASAQGVPASRTHAEPGFDQPTAHMSQPADMPWSYSRYSDMINANVEFDRRARGLVQATQMMPYTANASFPPMPQAQPAHGGVTPANPMPSHLGYAGDSYAARMYGQSAYEAQYGFAEGQGSHELGLAPFHVAQPNYPGSVTATNTDQQYRQQYQQSVAPASAVTTSYNDFASDQWPMYPEDDWRIQSQDFQAPAPQSHIRSTIDLSDFGKSAEPVQTTRSSDPQADDGSHEKHAGYQQPRYEVRVGPLGYQATPGQPPTYSYYAGFDQQQAPVVPRGPRAEHGQYGNSGRNRAMPPPGFYDRQRNSRYPPQ